jgi:hypothetical protein
MITFFVIFEAAKKLFVFLTVVICNKKLTINNKSRFSDEYHSVWRLPIIFFLLFIKKNILNQYAIISNLTLFERQVDDLTQKNYSFFVGSCNQSNMKFKNNKHF